MSGWLRPGAVRAHDGGRPSVQFRTNPWLAAVAAGAEDVGATRWPGDRRDPPRGVLSVLSGGLLRDCFRHEVGMGTGRRAGRGASTVRPGEPAPQSAGAAALLENGGDNVASHVTGVSPGGAETRLPVRVEPEEFVTQPPLELTAAGGLWWRRA